ncbi:MAG: di/tricarboxylate transporter [Kiritimatiellia bacterium]|jgi:di/tricarboxylate transporter
MPVAGWITLFVLLGMTVVIARDRIGPDLTMFGALAILVGFGVIDPMQAAAGFANPALLTIGALFVMAAAVRETGALRMMSQVIFGRAHTTRAGLFRLLLPTALLSGFLNNTPIVAMFIPLAKGFARRIDESPSRFLMPLGFAAMLGGTCTLIGTSANLVVSSQLQQAELPPLGMLEIGWVGVPTMVVGLIYLMTAGHWLLGRRKAPRETMAEDARQYLAELQVAADSPLIGKTVVDAGLRHLPGLFLAEIHREDGRTVRPVSPQDRLVAGDLLILSGQAATVADLRELPGLQPVDDLDIGDLERHLFEVVISHRSSLVGRTVREAGFRRRFDAAILGVHRAGERIDRRIGDIVLRPGDTLMLSASPGFRAAWQNSAYFYLVSAVQEAPAPNYRSANLTLIILSLLVLLPVVSTAIPGMVEVPIAAVAMLAVVALLVTRCITARQARQAIDWSVLLVIGCALGLAQALDHSGAAAVLAQGLVSLAGWMPGIVLLALIYVISLTTASLLTNAAAAALVFPVAIAVAQAAQLDPRPFAITVALAASAGFATPVGSNATLLTYGPGGYRYLDYTRVGLPLNALCLVIALVVVPLVWPLVP